MVFHAEMVKTHALFIKSKHFAGLLATIIGVISFIPILFTVHNTKKTSNFPYRALILALISNTLWFYYALTKDSTIDIQLASMGVLYFLIYSFILYIKINH